MVFNSTTLFAYLRKAPFGGRLTQQQITGVESILSMWEKEQPGISDIRHLAYVLATAFHETGGRMVPVREGFADSDVKARAITKRYAYGKVDPVTRQVYYGRGLVQLTWGNNYKQIGAKLGLDLYKNPDSALEPDTAAIILIRGMVQGFFTHKRLLDYFDGTADDPVGARRIVNGFDKAKLVADYYKHFLEALKAAETITPQPKDVVKSDAKPDSAPLHSDKTTLGAVTGILGAGGAGLLTNVDNLYALIAVLVVGFGVILFLTGRLELRRKAGA